jgi:hypothetical protein
VGSRPRHRARRVRGGRGGGGSCRGAAGLAAPGPLPGGHDAGVRPGHPPVPAQPQALRLGASGGHSVRSTHPARRHRPAGRAEHVLVLSRHVGRGDDGCTGDPSQPHRPGAARPARERAGCPGLRREPHACQAHGVRAVRLPGGGRRLPLRAAPAGLHACALRSLGEPQRFHLGSGGWPGVAGRGGARGARPAGRAVVPSAGVALAPVGRGGAGRAHAAARRSRRPRLPRPRPLVAFRRPPPSDHRPEPGGRRAPRRRTRRTGRGAGRGGRGRRPGRRRPSTVGRVRRSPAGS